MVGRWCNGETFSFSLSQSFFSLCNLPQRKVSTQPLVINLSSPTPSNPLIKYKFLGVKVKLGSEIRYVFQQVWGGGGGMIFYLFIVSHPLQTGQERRKTERKKENVSPLHHRPTTERRSFVWERKIKFLNFYWSMPQWMNEWEENISFVVFGAVDWPSSRVDYTERRNFCLEKF